MGLLHRFGNRSKNGRVNLQHNSGDSFERAIGWLKSHKLDTGGIPPHHKSKVATQEVSGYLIPTLYRAGQKEFAQDLALWEARVQQPNGSFTAPDGVAYTFDTAQVIRGFLAILDELPELEGNLRSACDYVVSQIGLEGKIHTPSYDQWRCSDGSIFSEYTDLYVLPPLLQAGKELTESRYVIAAERGLRYFKQKPDLVQFKPEMSTLSHIFGYMMEALVELGETSLAEEGLLQAAAIQEHDGAIPAYPGARWVCSTGMAQLAIAWYKLGNHEPADRAMGYLEKIQNASGGFYGSYGAGAKYLPTEEISWAVKFFLDAFLLQVEKGNN